ncbi:hypothetical protein AVEN_250868-1 [Araneus ventricosus]|uniref:Uncharacterized protein n=1 Tax=Araneus ventricosus TaxID=182803 RepID=A0A4Y2IQR1_ARAVE|nr:hypothetical protein AVEN_250868-1 [Araneus ventricosus]
MKYLPVSKIRNNQRHLKQIQSKSGERGNSELSSVNPGRLWALGRSIHFEEQDAPCPAANRKKKRHPERMKKLNAVAKFTLQKAEEDIKGLCGTKAEEEKGIGGPRCNPIIFASSTLKEDRGDQSPGLAGSSDSLSLQEKQS